MLATLLLSQGVPMLLAGDEIGRTQHGNNNAYCHDDALGWIDWTPTPTSDALLALIERLGAIRRRHACLRRETFLTGTRNERDRPDVAWLAPDFSALSGEDWHRSDRRAFAMWLAGDTSDTSLALLLNGSLSAVEFHLPELQPLAVVLCLLDSGDPLAPEALIDGRVQLTVGPLSVVVLAIQEGAA
jgi:pullulanase/glycogen debranching enzyme